VCCEIGIEHGGTGGNQEWKSLKVLTWVFFWGIVCEVIFVGESGVRREAESSSRLDKRSTYILGRWINGGERSKDGLVSYSTALLPSSCFVPSRCLLGKYSNRGVWDFES
jgi:hypothetical protein